MLNSQEKTKQKTKLPISAKEADKENSSTKQLIEYIPIEDSPFTAVRKEEEWFLMMGRYRLNNTPFKTLKEVKEDAKDASWHRIMQVVGVMIDQNLTIIDLQKDMKELKKIEGFLQN